MTKTFFDHGCLLLGTKSISVYACVHTRTNIYVCMSQTQTHAHVLEGKNILSEFPRISRRSNLLPVEYFFVSVFALEVTIAIVALGFIRGKKSYLQISAMHVSTVFFPVFLA
jgi:hypothetical protein